MAEMASAPVREGLVTRLAYAEASRAADKAPLPAESSMLYDSILEL